MHSLLFIWVFSLHTDETVVLAFQHYIVMLGTTVFLANTLVTPMGGDPVCYVFGFLIQLLNVYGFETECLVLSG